MNEQIHAGGSNSQGLDSVHLKHAMAAPKIAVESGGQIKTTGGKNSQGADSIHIQHALRTESVSIR